MAYSILTEVRIKPSVANLQPNERSYSVYWSEDANLQGWTSISDLDIVGTWSGFLYGTKKTATTGSIGPTSTFPPVDAVVNNRLFFRMKYDKHPKNPNSTSIGKIQWITVADPVFNDDKSVTFDVFPDGKWHFYEVDVGQEASWVGLVNNIRLFPCINGYINDEFLLGFFEIGTTDFSFSFDNVEAGTPGKVVGYKVLSQSITIEKDVNDKLLVNIDGYGDVQIVLTPQSAPPEIIARDISFQLGKIAIGGYLRAEAYIDSTTRKLTIESGTRAADSSVTIGGGSAGFVLGLLDEVGTFLGTAFAGSNPVSNYTPLSSYRLTTLEILALFDNDKDLPAFSLDPQTYVVQAGRADYGTTNQKVETVFTTEGRSTNNTGVLLEAEGTLSGEGKTLIDLNHPFTDEGKLEIVAFNGISDVNGGTKWKIFRPKLDGSLEMINEGVIGETEIVENPDGGLVLTTSPSAFSVNILSSNIWVRRGDLLGIYNASFHLFSSDAEKVNAMYYELVGDVTGSVTPSQPSGAGELGLPIYARGSRTKNRAVVDIDLGRRLNLDRLIINGEEEVGELEYNIAASSSAQFSADVFGSHTVCYTYDLSLGLRTCFTRNNQGFNIQALNDNIVLSENGISSFGDPGEGGAGGANVTGATYFYVNGDGEFLGVHDFVGREPKAYEFSRDSIGIDCYFSSSTPRLDKPVGKAVIYFKDKKNQRSWQIETALGTGAKGGNGSKPGFQLIPEITSVEVDNKKINRLGHVLSSKPQSNLQNMLLNNPVILDVIAEDGTRNPQQGIDFVNDVGELGGVNLADQITYAKFQWNRFEWNFSPIRTSGFRWFTDYHWSTKISEFQVFAISDSEEALGDNTQPLFSSDGTVFTTAALESSDAVRAVYKLGGSPQYLRLIFRPTLKLDINEVEFIFEEDQISFGDEGRLSSPLLVADSRIGQAGESTPVKIINATGETADLILDIPADISSARQLLYFNRFKNSNSILCPDIGSPGRIDFNPDKVLKEEKNIANKAKCYGLRNITSGITSDYISSNLLINPGFESGDITGWNLNVIQSGTAVDVVGIYYQVPRVMDILTPGPDSVSAGSFQEGNYVFGFCMENSYESLYRNGPYIPIEFEISQIVDISSYAENVDSGGVTIDFYLRYMVFFSDSSEDPYIYVYGAPTTSGINVDGSTFISGYGSTLLKSLRLTRSVYINDQLSPESSFTLSFSVAVKTGTRFVKLLLYVDADYCKISGSQYRQKVLLDDFSACIRIPALMSAKWYKSWRDGIGSSNEFDGFTDSHFEPITEFTKTIGSTHWYQPWYNTGASYDYPVEGQNVGFSNVFTFNRFIGIQSYRRMTSSDPGFLGAQWEGERKLAGLKIGLWHRPNDLDNAPNHPKHFHIEVLKTRAELGGIEPDINNPAHFEVARIYRSFSIKSEPDFLSFNSSNDDGRKVPETRLLTLLFEDGPITTEGMKIVFTLNCDRFEKDAYPSVAEYASVTGCTQFITMEMVGLSATAFTPLESLNITSLPLDNVREGNRSGNVYAAVDLGRRYDISTDTDLFELIARTPTTSTWNISSVQYSADETGDPNQVSWTGGSSNARWIRFVSSSKEESESESDVQEYSASSTEHPPYVTGLPQSIIDQARIYPNIQTTSIHTVGYNAAWDDLGYVLTDARNDTFIYYSDYPIIALDLGKKYLISSTEVSLVRQRHDFVSGTPSVLNTCDYKYWNPSNESNFTYSLVSAGSLGRPETVPFRAFGAGIPDYATRWVAFKGAYPLLCQSQDPNRPKEYNFQTLGQALYGVVIRPRSSQIVTENAHWFSSNRAVLRDISTFSFEPGIPLNITNGVDYGSKAGYLATGSVDSANDLGDPYNAFDGVYDELVGDVWGVSVRDMFTGLDDSNKDFPHSIWRVFRDPFSGTVYTKDVRAIFFRGYNEIFYPKTFKFQKLLENLDGTNKDPALDESWEDIENALFTNVDTFQEGAGFFHIFPNAVSTKGIRISVTDSEYPDDSVVTQTDETGRANAIQADVVGPQTRISEVVIYDQTFDEAILEGEITINHALGSTVSSITAVPDHGPEKAVDGDSSTFWQATGFQDTLTINLPRQATVHSFVWEKDQSLDQLTGGVGLNAPQDFTLSAVVSGDTITILNKAGHLGTTYSGTFSIGAVTSDTFIFDITRVQGQQTDASSIQLSELYLNEIFNQNTPLVIIESTPDRRPGGINQTSTMITYASESDIVANIYADGIYCGSDSYFSERDFFSLWIHINNALLLDTDYGSIKLGNNDRIFYSWDIANISFHSGWNELKLQFSQADNNTPIVFQPGAQFDPDTGLSKVDFITEDIEVTEDIDGATFYGTEDSPGIRYFELEFRGVKGNNDLKLILDDFRIIRNNFEDTCKFGKSLYLNNSEVFVINQEGLDTAIGTIEFWMQPDWDTGGRLRTGSSIVPAIFRIMRPDGRFLSFFYRPNQGFVGMVYDNEQLLQFETSVSGYRFERYDTFHVAVVWDYRGRIAPYNASFAIYIDGKPVFGTNKTWKASREPGAAIVFGGEVGQNFAASPFNATALTFSPIAGMASKNTASTWSLIENLKIYNFAKTDFSDINESNPSRVQLINPSEMIEISSDNVNFFGLGSDSLPIVIKAVPDNTSTTVYVRTIIPKHLTGREYRDASLLVRWKTPLRSCD